ncbi:hypothetical protein [Sphingomonas arenae]|uniref:hypothetical protein n=1 Tax=Sphingomonas arenae TaxID=2812555 RepID=UPI001966DF45|nr:hypothetical protein [Sphingomonas arenae]
MSNIRFTTFPRTEPPAAFIYDVIDVFRAHEQSICTISLEKGLESNAVLAQLCPGLQKLGFQVEVGKTNAEKIRRPVFFGENGKPNLEYQVDAFQPEWRCGLEVEAGRGAQGNAVYKDLVQAMVMVDVDTLILALANNYKYRNTKTGKIINSADYDKAVAIADALYRHDRIRMPYRLAVVGY